MRAFRELDDALLRLRLNHLDVGTIALRTQGEAGEGAGVGRVPLGAARALAGPRGVAACSARTLKRLDLTAKTLYAFLEPGSCFAGSLAELALASDRSFMLDDASRPVHLQLGVLNAGAFPMSNGLSRLDSRFLATPGRVPELLSNHAPLEAGDALAAGLVTFAPDEIDWDDEIRVALEERASLSPDALTGMEANLRFCRPGDDGDQDLRAPLGLAELDLPAPQRHRRARRPVAVRAGRCSPAVRHAPHVIPRLTLEIA